MRLKSSREYRFEADRATVWDAIAQVEEFPLWWPWLRVFDGTSLATGAVWQCVVQPPLPYSLRFAITLDAVTPGVSAAATIAGDISGSATLALTDDGDGCVAVMTSDLAPEQGVLRAVATLMPPVARFGHDWVLDSGARQFVDRALRESETRRD